MSSPEPPLKSEMPAAVPQSPPMRPGGSTMTRTVEPASPSRFKPGAGFGRFQGLVSGWTQPSRMNLPITPFFGRSESVGVEQPDPTDEARFI